MKKIIKRLAVFIAVIILLVVSFFGVLTITEYRPADIEKQEIQYHSGSSVSALSRPQAGVPFNLLSWNIGYASLDETQDFFMDGGKIIRPASDENVRRNIAGIRDFISGAGCETTLIQEADIASRRSYYVDQRAFLTEHFSGVSAFAYNFKCILVPIPFPEVIGRVSSGLLVLNRFETKEAVRMSLPNPFSWPVRAANLKRCLLVSRVPLQNSGVSQSKTPELVIVNLHLEAYDSSGGREAQTKALLDFLYSEYAKGNYCIAGGDFNQNFPGIDPVRYAVKKSDYFTPGTLSPSLLANGWQYAADKSTPSCRLLNEPFSGDLDNTQLYIIDGFILSPNVELIEVKTFDLGFKYSDHNPVKMRVMLK